MTPEQWRRVEDLFNQAADVQEPELHAWLERECAGDADLLREVSAMLSADAETRPMQDRIQARIRGAASQLLGTPLLPDASRAGPYRLTSELGRGGMGAVYLGERDDGQYQGQVAVKIIRPGLDTEFFLDRFKRERQALARLQHPNIARLLDSGSTRDGHPYIVMELVRGIPINAYRRKANLSVNETLRLFLAVCRAVAHAHQRFVVHRDLKPGNILVEEDGTPKLLDFGICKLLEDTPADGRAETATGGHMLTPDYASPEQVRGEPITAASDIYSLGALLFELLVGRGPHKIDQFTPLAIHKAICEDETPRPSEAALDPMVGRALAGDLDTILLKALQKDSERRYPSAEQFAEDLRRVLDHEPVLARPDNPWYRAAKLIERHRVPVLASAAVAISLVAGLVISVNQARIANQRLLQVRKLANAFVFNVHNSVSKLPGSLEARRLILETGTQYLDSVAATARDDSPLQIDLAEAYLRMAEVQGDASLPNLGKVPEAIASFEKARALAGAVLEREPGNLRAGTVWVTVGRAARAYAMTFDDARAQAVLKASIRTGERLLIDHSNDADLRGALANSYFIRGNLASESRGEGGDISRDFERCIELLKPLTQLDPERGLLLVKSQTGLGVQETDAGHYHKALGHLTAALAGATRATERNPADTAAATSLMLILSHIADVKFETGDTPAALSLAARAVEIARKIRNSDSSDERGAAYEGIAILEHAKLLASTRDRIAPLAEARTLLERAVEKNASYGQFRVYLAETCAELGLALAGSTRGADSEDAYRCAIKIAEPILSKRQPVAVRGYIDAIRGLGERAVARGNRAEALDFAAIEMRVVELGAALPPVLMGRALVAAGAIHALAGDKEPARSLLRRGLEVLTGKANEPGREPGRGIHLQINRVREQLEALGTR